MQDDIYEDFKAKYERMLLEDENKQKIERAKVEMYNNEMDEEEGGCNRGSSSEFISKVQEYSSIMTKDLPVSEKEQLIAMKRSPGFILTWLGEWLKQAEKNGRTFLNDYPFDIKIEEFGINFDEESKKVELKFTFDVEDDLEDLLIVGDLVCIKGDKIAIDWHKEEGNEFWLTSIIGELNRELKVLA